MKRILIFKYYFSSFPKYLYIIFFISLIIVTIQELFLFKTDAIFPGAYEIGQIIEKILLSFISGVVFYFITNHYPKQLKKKNLNVIIHNSLFGQKQITLCILYSLFKKLEIKQPIDIDKLSKTDILKILTPKIIDTPIEYVYDHIVYQDLLHLFEAVQISFTNFYQMLTPYIEYVNHDELEAMTESVNYLTIIHNPQKAIITNMSYTANVYSTIIFELLSNTNKYCV